MDFLHISLRQPAGVVADELFGNEADAAQAVLEGSPPGRLGTSSPAMLYLADLQQVDLSLAWPLYRLAQYRTYVDKLGSEWKVGEDLWIVGALTYPSENTSISFDHWLCAAFQLPMQVLPPASEDDVLQVCKSIVAQHPFGGAVQADLGHFLVSQPQIRDNLHSVRRWLNLALDSKERGSSLSADDLRRAMLDDLRWILPRLQYRGRQFNLPHFERWARQFPRELSALSVHLIREIAERYYVGVREFYEGLDFLIRNSDPKGKLCDLLQVAGDGQKRAQYRP